MSPVSAAQMQNSEDTEITLGAGKMLALFFALVILCAIFFGMGYSFGRNSVKSSAELLPSPSTSTPARVSPSAARANTPPKVQPDSQAKSADQQPASGDTNSGTTGTSAAAPSDQTAAGTVPQPVAGYFVQVAAVSKQEDAQALVESLKGRQYEAFIADPSADKLFHVQVGPFADVKDAESMRTRLVNDGYNPILKK